MLPLLSQRIKKASVLCRLTFAAAKFPPSTPYSWEAVAAFASVGTTGEGVTADDCRLFAENITSLDTTAFATDAELLIELCSIPRGPHSATGLVLISPQGPDRFSKLVVFNEKQGTLPATHYTKYCRKKGCSYQQHYGYHSFGNGSEVFYERSCLDSEYFVSSRETAFSTEMLKKLDVEILTFTAPRAYIYARASATRHRRVHIYMHHVPLPGGTRILLLRNYELGFGCLVHYLRVIGKFVTFQSGKHFARPALNSCAKQLPLPPEIAHARRFAVRASPSSARENSFRTGLQSWQREDLLLVKL